MLFVILLSITSHKTFAYDIAVENADGVTIYYNFINDGKELEVTSWYYSGSVNIPEDVTYMNNTYKVTSIGKDSFKKCEDVTSISIPNSVNNIGDWAFCATMITSITIPSGVTKIGESVFNGCDQLTTVNIPNNVISIGYKAFYKCLNLKSINIPNNVTTIGELAFWECRSLTSVTIPNSVTSIGANAFNGEDENIPNIQTITSLIDNPFEIYGKSSYKSPNGRNYLGVFNPNTFNNAILYVPKGTIDKYKVTNGWKDFLYIKEGTGPNGGGETPKKCSTPTISYQNGKLIFNCDTEGATCHYAITNEDIKSGSGNEVQLGITYHISVYATKYGYEDSDVATKDIKLSDNTGDINGDKKVDAADVVKLVNIIMKTE